MTQERFTFQQKCISGTTGKVLNVGCHKDPANLKSIFGNRIINCDKYPTNSEGEALAADILFDASSDVWPFETNEAEMVVLGDVLEHFTIVGIRHALMEARRVASKLCITVPEDHRIELESYKELTKGVRQGDYHITVVTLDLIANVLVQAGWQIRYFEEVDYICISKGYFIYCIHHKIL